MAATTFEMWMKKVDRYIAAATGMTSEDLPDCCYRDWYDDEMPASEAAQEAIAESMN